MAQKEMELQISKFWDEKKIFEKSVEQRPKENQYIFYDGPPFATGTPHYGHILCLTSKDLFPRYKTMRGQRVERKWGWDCHGLPIENIVEKELGIKNKKQIEEMGISKFNETCRAQVLAFADEWGKTVKKIGKWIEFDNSYKTMDNTYMETIWWMFKKFYDEGHIYEGKKILMYCPRCQTPLANAEIQMDNSYKDVTERTVTVKLKSKDNDYTFLAWTTTPWTLIGNAALAINPALTYVIAEIEGEKFVLVKDRLEAIAKGKNYKILKEASGKEFLGEKYVPLYDIKRKEKGYYVIDGGNEVTAEDGTGIVHMAIYGEYDYEMIKKYNLPIIQHVGNDGTIKEGPKEMLGMWFKSADKAVLEDLENRKLVYSFEDYTHSYPFCCRCETPLFYNAVDSWFVNIQKLKKKILEKSKKINWHPADKFEKRFLNIIETAPDWSISRNRFWATAIPVWKCDCGNIKVIGSITELKENAIEKVEYNTDLHKHVVDQIHLKCNCGGTMTRIPEVLDCWFESGSMPYASKHYPFENAENFNSVFPADFVSEYTGQIRTWFYYMHVLGVMLFNEPPFKHIAVTGNILAEDGQKMSKSKKNYPDPNLILDKYGADSLRFYLMSSPVMKGEDINFSEIGLKDVHRRVSGLLPNIKSFYELFCEDNKELNDTSSKHILDKWIISRTNELIVEVTKDLDNYDTSSSGNKILDYIVELSTWYVRRSRDRFKGADLGDKQAATRTLGYTLQVISKLIAPFSPFIAEDIHQSLRKYNKRIAESVHLEMWPEADKKLIQKEINTQMALTRDIVSKALGERETTKIPIKQPLSKLTVEGVKLDKEYLELIKDEINVKEIVLKEGKEIKLELDTTITEELILEKVAREVIRSVNELRKGANLTLKDRITLFVDTESKNIKKAVEDHKKEIMNSVQADKIEFKASKEFKEKEIDGEKIRLGFSL